MNDSNELQHHGILGMKWGVRRYQNKDGSLTPAGKRREANIDRKMLNQARKYNELKRKKLTNTNTNNSYRNKIKGMSDEELRTKTNRLELENRYVNASRSNKQNLNPKTVSKGKEFVNTVAKGIILTGTIEVGKEFYKRVLSKEISKQIEKRSTK